jgi:protein involved in polysaccharide export with SLBB domain
MKATFFMWMKNASLLPLSLLLLAGIAKGQEAQPQTRKTANSIAPAYSGPLQSDLSRDNNDRVAATPAQIKEVLVTDPGLMVELKRWIAKEASDTGRIVTDEELSDNAVFDRLANDVKFRAVATRLLQRYGYLRPVVNPESEMGKEQDLVLKERARRIVQLEAQEDAEASRLPESKTAQAKARSCDPKNMEDAADFRDCLSGAPTHPNPSGDEGAGTTGLPDFSQPNEQQSLPLDPRILRAQGGETDDGTLGGLGGANADSGGTLQTISSSSRVSDEEDKTMSGASGGASRGQLGGSPLETMIDSADRLGESQTSATDAMLSASNPADKNLSVSPRATRLIKDRNIAPESMVHRPNPYADIPALYDLYVQAPSRDLPPQRFGTQVFRDGLRDSRSIPMDLPVGPEYVVGPGDSLTINLWGGISTKILRVVDRQGRVTLPEAGPLLVSGRSLGEVQQAMQKAISAEYRDTSVEVAVARLRTIRIYVVGEVNNPGAYDISSLSTVLNALVSAGGATRQGSLRNLEHMRGQQELERIDAYDLLLRGVTPNGSRLESGDTLMVPPVGPQVTVTGMVRRPAIYELNGEKTLVEVLDLAGGILPAAALQHVEVQRLEAHEKRTMLSLDLSSSGETPSQLTSFKVQDGDEIHIFPIATYNQETIYLQGHVLRPGRYSYHEGMKLNDLVTSYKDVLPEPASHYAEIIRLNPPDFRPSVVSFDFAAAMADPAAAPSLQPLDTVRIFSRFDFEPTPIVSVAGEVRFPGTYKTSGQVSLRDAVYLAGGLTPDAAQDTAQLFRLNADGTSEIFSVNLREALSGTVADNIWLEPRDRLLIHRNKSRVEPSTVEVQGEVAKPGRYPFTDNMHVGDLIRAAGGLKVSADGNTADLTRYTASGGSRQQLQVSLAALKNGNASEDLPLHNGDVLAIRQAPGWSDVGASVKVNGEVLHPSTYGIEPGERLSSLLARAGGYTQQAYPYGAVLMRREVRELENKNQQELISRLKAERDMLRSLPEGTEEQRNAKLTAVAETNTRLSQLAENPPIGRVVIHIDKNVKEWKNTASDIALRDGDTLFIPKKANVVSVNGQVYNPTAISAQPGRSARWYLSQAGGLTPLAEKKAVFVIRADGSVVSAKNNNDGWWSGDPLNAALRPGDTVVVPERTPKIGGPNWQLLFQSAQVISSVALAVAYIHP